MPAIVAFIWSGLVAILPSLIGRILVALGLGMVSYKGLDILVNKAEAFMMSYLNQSSQDVVGLLSFLGVIAVVKMHTATLLSIAAVLMADKSIKAVSK